MSEDKWQPAILLPISQIKCELHRGILESLPPINLIQRDARVGQQVKICLTGRGRGIGLGSIRIPEGECLPVKIMDKDGLIAGAFSCEFATD